MRDESHIQPVPLWLHTKKPSSCYPNVNIDALFQGNSTLLLIE